MNKKSLLALASLLAVTVMIVTNASAAEKTKTDSNQKLSATIPSMPEDPAAAGLTGEP